MNKRTGALSSHYNKNLCLNQEGQNWNTRLQCLHSSSAAVSVKDSNGTFVSTLSMILYNVSTRLMVADCICLKVQNEISFF